MTITKTQNGTQLEILLEGRLDTTTAPELEEELKTALDGVTELTMDFEKLEYISSAGLRVLLNAQKKANATGGTMTLTHVNDEIMDVFDMTGFISFLTIE